MTLGNAKLTGLTILGIAWAPVWGGRSQTNREKLLKRTLTAWTMPSNPMTCKAYWSGLVDKTQFKWTKNNSKRPKRLPWLWSQEMQSLLVWPLGGLPEPQVALPECERVGRATDASHSWQVIIALHDHRNQHQVHVETSHGRCFALQYALHPVKHC